MEENKPPEILNLSKNFRTICYQEFKSFHYYVQGTLLSLDVSLRVYRGYGFLDDMILREDYLETFNWNMPFKYEIDRLINYMHVDYSINEDPEYLCMFYEDIPLYKQV